MLPIIGLAVVLACVFGSYVISGGKLGIVLHGLPLEGLAILGGAIGAMIIGNKSIVLKKVAKGFGAAFKGAKWHESDYKDLLCLLFLLCKLMKSKGMIAVEQHVEKPAESSIFKQFPNILADSFSIELICDTLRMMTMGVENPYVIEDVIEKQLEKHHHESNTAGHVLQSMADGLPAIGIVAAVLGVIKTMASINSPPEVLGEMIGGALVGTFLGVFTAYCLVGPLATKIIQSHDTDHHFYCVIREVIVAHLKGLAPQLSMEIGRGAIPGYYQPTFSQMEEATSTLKAE